MGTPVIDLIDRPRHRERRVEFREHKARQLTASWKVFWQHCRFFDQGRRPRRGTTSSGWILVAVF